METTIIIINSPKPTKRYLVTGTFHGSIVLATTEGEARRIFHRAYNGESIIDIKQSNLPLI